MFPLYIKEEADRMVSQHSEFSTFGDMADSVLESVGSFLGAFIHELVTPYPLPADLQAYA